ncbi:hypothetical protein MIND_00243100 [Mycena indigotica]|uniref:Uncharacterized protein n=1 Tax=Mycena indigotica TaxID=2126181 RepID=A0A8H6WDA8_9AGAR|nr:uncharacterized protein MIND_00243100 [Mycena indigotica]KAF7312301.1 hypothetical protein MIND_00243100 [Mycena indigotica]
MFRHGPSACRRNRAFVRWTSSYPSKVRAFPFKLSPQDALEQMSNYMVSASYNLQAALDEVLRQKPQPPEKMVAIYFPAWLIDAEVEALVTVSGEASRFEGVVTTTFTNSYLPGHTMNKLSTTSLLSDLSLEEAVPFSSDLLEQHGTNITCLPFQTTPFPMVEDAKRLPAEAATIGNFHIDPSSIQVNLMAAYPILLPLYLAQFTFFDISKTVVVEAHSEEPRISVERVHWSKGSPAPNSNNPPDSWLRRFVGWNEKSTEDAPGRHSKYFWYPQGSLASFSNIASYTIPSEWPQRLANTSVVPPSLLIPDLGSWLDSKLTPESLRSLVRSNDTMEDPRVRPFVEEEVNGVRKFFQLSEERAKAYAVLDGVSRDTTGDKDETLAEVRDYAFSSDRLRDEATPSWWRVWESK